VCLFLLLSSPCHSAPPILAFSKCKNKNKTFSFVFKHLCNSVYLRKYTLLDFC
jgi:hypothetical protein